MQLRSSVSAAHLSVCLYYIRQMYHIFMCSGLGGGVHTAQLRANTRTHVYILTVILRRHNNNIIMFTAPPAPAILHSAILL